MVRRVLDMVRNRVKESRGDKSMGLPVGVYEVDKRTEEDLNECLCGHEFKEHILRRENGAKGCMAWRKNPERNGMCQCNCFVENVRDRKFDMAEV
jgi:hypothetical protein